MPAGERSRPDGPQLIPLKIIGSNKHLLVVKKTHINPLAVGNGCTRRVTVEGMLSLQRCRGTMCYVAPELLESVVFEPSADVYSMAIVLWEMWLTSTLTAGQ